jgi:hypothetical protein
VTEEAAETAWNILSEMLESNADLVEKEAERVHGAEELAKQEADDQERETEQCAFARKVNDALRAKAAAEQHLSAADELSAYRKTHVPKGVKCLDWWRANAKTFPRIALLARMILASPASSAPSERVFSKLNIVVQRRTARLDAERAGRRVFLCGNAKYFDKPRIVPKKKRKTVSQ